jgi:hypothetical protein
LYSDRRIDHDELQHMAASRFGRDGKVHRADVVLGIFLEGLTEKELVLARLWREDISCRNCSTNCRVIPNSPSTC